ncbi:MAG TPA: SufD family Fe-S cluster assembly protein [Steroidobacteraceae bacterium]|nr:SufD family Fe-S cluster assembly protein [Steroidobacteraceae bacterium]
MSALPAVADRARGTQALERVLRDFEAAAADLPDEVLPQAARRSAAHELARLGWPQARDEQWRYANLRAFERIGSFLPARRRPGDAALRIADPAPELPAQLPPALPGFERLVFVDGVRCGSRANAPQESPSAGRIEISDPWTAEQRLGLLGEMFAQDAAVLRVTAQSAIEVLCITTARASRAAVYPRLLVELAPAAQLTLVERHLGDAPEPALVSATVRIRLARAAQLTHYRLQQCGPQLLFDDSLQASLESEACYHVRQISIGAQAARTSARVRLAGRGAALGWHALAVGQAEQVHDTTLSVEHGAAATRTEERFRGIANARSRLSFSGHIHIHAAAAGASAQQSLRGLLEGTHAEIDLRPRLQIDVDEVTAQHGATTGRLDENLLFYLLSRGLDAQTARTLLKWAFLGDVLRSIELPELRAQAEQAAAGQLADTSTLAELTAAAGTVP